MSISFRPYASSNVNSVRQHLSICWEETYQSIIGDAALAELIATLKSEDIGGIYSGGEETCFIAVDGSQSIDNHIIGTCVAVCRQGIGYVWGCYVQQAYQRRGIGSELMRHCLVKLENVETVELSVLKDSLSAQRFYASLGFQKIRDDEYEMTEGGVQPTNVLNIPYDTLIERLSQNHVR
jgi:ribosomal protein S18 acetylase RimI-like enzyme